MKTKKAIDKMCTHYGLELESSTINGYRNKLLNFCLFVRNKKIQNVTQEDVEDYLHMKLDLGWKQNSVAVDVVPIRKMFQYLKLKGYDVLDPELVPSVKREFTTPDVINEKEHEKLIEVAEYSTGKTHTRNKAMLMMLWDTGVRVGELLELDVGDIDLDENQAFIGTEKARRKKNSHRWIVWSDETSNVLERWLEERKRWDKKIEDPQALFVGYCTNDGRCGVRISRKGFNLVISRYCREAGIEPTKSAHAYRHAKGRRILKNGGNTRDVADILGHADEQYSYTYVRLNGDEQKKKAKELL